ncbi:hypothetical protein HNP84_007410 [Thermocatellispora tengchongensis]|uniref:Uncharacterized protein n=1 Tax=Thermocatellispora tengchongensis TaxID=1073253 RepID=A0A840PDG7_9ACTN|nr:hypothetical protein [Thermocatellispora tengchongensis]
MTGPDRPSGAKTLAIILLVMMAVLAGIAAIAIWAANGS